MSVQNAMGYDREILVNGKSESDLQYSEGKQRNYNTFCLVIGLDVPYHGDSQYVYL